MYFQNFLVVVSFIATGSHEELGKQMAWLSIRLAKFDSRLSPFLSRALS
jgi:tRNA isopentenyl-2-thiomethyl-A-37 hydroxylase MiaE